MSVGHEIEGRFARHRDGRARVVREHEDGDVVGRVVAPPSLPAVVRPGAARRREHVAAHDPRAEVLHASRGKIVVDPPSTAFVTDRRAAGMHSLERLRVDDPCVEGFPSDAQRVRQILVRTGAVAIDGD
jgi:hypothetical protein